MGFPRQEYWSGLPTLVSGSYEAVRSSDLDVSKTFDVHMQDTRIGDVFSSFPEDSGDVLTAQSIVEEVDRIRLDITNAQPKRSPLHFTLS